MKKNSPLYNTLNTWLSQASPWAHQWHLKTCVWMVAALLQTGEINLTRWIPYVPCGGYYALILRLCLRRWLNNARINVHRLYKPLIQTALLDWQENCIYVSLDTSMFWEQYCLIRLAVIHRGRALPIIWRTLEHGSASVSWMDDQEMLQQAVGRLPL